MNEIRLLSSQSADYDAAATLEVAQSSRKSRGGGIQARERILAAALRLFVGKGYASTSVREIVQNAQVNIASIAYYFGDKAGLYRAVLNEPVQHVADDNSPFDAPGISLNESLMRYMRTRLLPLGEGESILLNVRLRLREILEPTGLVDDEHTREQAQQRLIAVLMRELGLDRPDPELHRLAYAIFSLITYPYIGHDHIQRVAPDLFDAPGAIDTWIESLACYATAMVDAERRRRAA